MIKTRKIPALLLALIIGFATEAVLGAISVISVLAGGIGLCGLTGDAPGFVCVVHQPGFWLAGLLVEDSSSSYLALAILLTTVFLSILAFVVLKFGFDRSEICPASAAPEQRDGK